MKRYNQPTIKNDRMDEAIIINIALSGLVTLIAIVVIASYLIR
jgi:hypothetical protein